MAENKVVYSASEDKLSVMTGLNHGDNVTRIGTDPFVFTRDGYPIRSNLVLDGDFELIVPNAENERLLDWSLTLDGLTMAYSRLNRQMVCGLFGQRVLSNIDIFYEAWEDRKNGKSGGAARLSHELRFDSGEIDDRILSQRKELLNLASYSYGRLIVPRSVLINDGY